MIRASGNSFSDLDPVIDRKILMLTFNIRHTVFTRIVAGEIIYFEAYFPQNILSIFEKINISENLIILADQ